MCPKCKSSRTRIVKQTHSIPIVLTKKCMDCGHIWKSIAKNPD